MIFDGKPTSEITPEEVEALRRDHVEEDAFLDYKAQPYARNEQGIRELVKDVSAFANAQGGYLIIGVGEEAGNPRHPGGFVNVEDPEGERRRMIDVCFEKIEPRLSELDIRAIPVGENTVLVCRMPESGQKPHCAKPDREHHYFWKRFEDGNRLMSVPEIRACLEGDRVLRELAEIRREFGHIRQQQIMAREAEQDITEGNVFQLETPEAFRRFVDDQFQQATDDKPYYRLTATPLPINQLNLRDRSQRIMELLHRPPELRPHGWDMSTYIDQWHRITAIGAVRNDIEYNHLRVLWNGHTEFWTQADDSFFRLRGDFPGGQQVEHQFLYPYGISEPVENFILLINAICHIADFDGELEFNLGFYRIRGLYLAPGHPQSLGYMRARSDAGREYGPHPLAENDLIAPSVRVPVGDLPDQVTWRLVSHVYQRFGHPLDEHVPFFDQDHHFTLGQPSPGGGA